LAETVLAGRERKLWDTPGGDPVEAYKATPEAPGRRLA
jgi:hypothetical protein